MRKIPNSGGRVMFPKWGEKSLNILNPYHAELGYMCISWLEKQCKFRSAGFFLFFSTLLVNTHMAYASNYSLKTHHTQLSSGARCLIILSSMSLLCVCEYWRSWGCSAFAYHICHHMYSKTCLKRPLKKRQNKDLNNKW